MPLSLAKIDRKCLIDKHLRIIAYLVIIPKKALVGTPPMTWQVNGGRELNKSSILLGISTSIGQEFCDNIYKCSKINYLLKRECERKAGDDLITRSLGADCITLDGGILARPGGDDLVYKFADFFSFITNEVGI